MSSKYQRRWKNKKSQIFYPHTLSSKHQSISQVKKDKNEYFTYLVFHQRIFDFLPSVFEAPQSFCSKIQSKKVYKSSYYLLFSKGLLPAKLQFLFHCFICDFLQLLLQNFQFFVQGFLFLLKCSSKNLQFLFLPITFIFQSFTLVVCLS